MPSHTFFKLNKVKQQKIFNAAAEEFCRVPYEEVSIKNIVKTASIARGSFYQYFTDKEDLFIFLTRQIRGDMQNAKSSEEDLFEYLISLANREIINITNQKEDVSYKAKIFHNIAKSPVAIMIFDREMELEVKSNPNFIRLVKKTYGSNIPVSKMEALIELISQSMKSAFLSVINQLKTVEEAMEDLKQKLDILKKGVESS